MLAFMDFKELYEGFHEKTFLIILPWAAEEEMSVIVVYTVLMFSLIKTSIHASFPFQSTKCPFFFFF